MGRLGVALLVMSVTAVAYGTEPGRTGNRAPAPPYAAVALNDSHLHPPSQVEFQTERLPPHPLRASLTSNEVSAVGVNASSERTIRVLLETDAVASFPVDANEAIQSAPAVSARSRLLTIRKNLDDDSGVFEHTGATGRLIRRSLDDASEWASVSAGRRLRSTLD